jgi:hypothetical protein
MVGQFPAFSGTQMLITALKTVHYWLLSRVTEIQRTPYHPVLSKSIFVSLSAMSYVFKEFSPNFLTKIMHSFSTFSLRATHPAHLIFLDVITLIFGEEYKL